MDAEEAEGEAEAEEESAMTARSQPVLMDRHLYSMVTGEDIIIIILITTN